MKSFFSRFFRGAIFLSLISLSFFFVSCSSGDDDASVYGRWRGAEYGDLYVITPIYFYAYYKDTDKVTDKFFYSGKIVGSEQLDDSSYYIYIRFTDYISYSTGKTDKDTVGKYYCIYVYNLSDTKCNISQAYKSNTSAVNTLSEAKKMTIEDGWFSDSSACVRE